MTTWLAKEFKISSSFLSKYLLSILLMTSMTPIISFSKIKGTQISDLVVNFVELSMFWCHLVSLVTSFTIRDCPFSATQPAIPSPTFTLYFFISLLFLPRLCLLYTSDAADEEDSVDL